MRRVSVSKSILERLYYSECRTLKYIAEEFGVSRQTISNKMKEYGLPVRNSKYIQEVKRSKKKPLKISKPMRYRDKKVFERVYKELKSLDLVAQYFEISQQQ